MIFISHRGNLNGKIPEMENSPEYINNAIKRGFDVEVDVWSENDFYLGHDSPKYKINFDYLTNKKIWCHCKNEECIEKLINTDVHFFWHENDKLTLTSKNFIWAYPDIKYPNKSIGVLPEKLNAKFDNCLGICSDYVLKYT
jgi:hypothetical protein